MIGLLGLGLPLDLLLLTAPPAVAPPPPAPSVAATPITRWDPWDRGTDLVLTVRAAELVDEDGIPVADTDVTNFTAVVADADVTLPPTPIPGRAAVPFVLAAGRYRAVLPYGSDLDSRTAVRLVVSATIAGRSVRLLESIARFTFADGL